MDKDRWNEIVGSDDALEDAVREGMEQQRNLGREAGEASSRAAHPAKDPKMPGTSPRHHSYWRGSDRGMFGGSY